MKKSAIAALLVHFLYLSASAQKIKQIEKIVYEWADATTSQDISRLQPLYAPTLIFYTITKDLPTCMQEKQAFFDLHPDYSLSISDIDIDFYKSGVVKCNFTKVETWKKNIQKPQTGYLLLEKRNGIYRITGESDSRMDTQKGFTLSLGEKKINQNVLLYMLIGAAAVLLIIGVIFWRNRRKKITAENLSAAPPANLTLDASITHEEKMIKTTLDPKTKGNEFENFVACRFDEKFGRFKIMHWRSDKMATNGLKTESSKYPDLEISFLTDNGNEQKFAIECKYRSNFYTQNNITGVKWAEQYQIDNYWEYSRKFNIPVWVTIGVGGTANNPEHIFLMRLEKLRGPFISEKELVAFKSRVPTHRFFYEQHTGNLKNQF